jgi:hypothetical protein
VRLNAPGTRQATDDRGDSDCQGQVGGEVYPLRNQRSTCLLACLLIVSYSRDFLPGVNGDFRTAVEKLDPVF